MCMQSVMWEGRADCQGASEAEPWPLLWDKLVCPLASGNKAE